MKTIAKTYFDANPSLQEIHLVGNNGFSKLERAEQHAAEVGDVVVSVKRSEVESAAGADELTVETIQQMKYADLKAKAAELKLEVADQKQATLVEALTNYLQSKK